MRKTIISAILLIGSINLCFGQLIAKVDERVELTGVVFRLTGVPEYTEGLLEEYNMDIDEYFKDFRYHDLTKFLVRLRNEDRLGYSAVAGSAMYLTIDKGRVKLNPKLSLSTLPGLGAQWKDEKTFRRYVELLNDFYRKSEFHKFYLAHGELYENMEGEMNSLFGYFKSEWFKDFFGEEIEYPCVYVALGNGWSNYYIMDYSTEAGYAIVIGGRKQFQLESVLPVMLHEICHNYTNPLFDKYWPEMQPAADMIYKHVEDDMWKNAYGSSEEMTVEWLNNLCTIMYFRDNLPPLAPYFTGELRDRGFIWLPRSVQFMENFYESRDKYSQIDSFMPQLVEFFRYTADNFDQVTFEFEHRRPYVVNVFPANGSNILNGDFTEINVTFSKPMTTDCYNVGIVENDGTIAKLPRSETINSYWKDPYTFIIPIEPSFLEKGKKYGLVLDHKGFMSKNLDMLEKDYILLYNTQEK